jgi:hypothetical protein
MTLMQPSERDGWIAALAYATAWAADARADWWRSHEVEYALDAVWHALPHVCSLYLGELVEDDAPDNDNGDEGAEDDFPPSW